MVKNTGLISQGKTNFAKIYSHLKRYFSEVDELPLIENQSFSSTPQASMTPYQKMEFQKNLAPKIQLDDATVEEVGSVNSDMIEMSDMSPPQSEKENIGTFIKS